MKEIKKVLFKDQIMIPDVNRITIGNIYNFMYKVGNRLIDVRGKVIRINNTSIVVILQPD